MQTTIGLLTDFGTADTYVGVMKGVIAAVSPSARVIDVTHAVPPGDIRGGAFQLWKAVRYFPEDSIFVIVVDPGVGTGRRPIVVSWQGRKLVAPDNGVLTYLLAASPPQASHELRSPRYRLEQVSSTFHGRDIFAPAGAHLAEGVPLEDFGPAIDALERIRLPTLRQDGAILEGEIVHIDGFGNLITSIGRFQVQDGEARVDPWLPHVEPASFSLEGLRVVLEDGTELRLHGTFGDVPEGDLVAYIGSEGLLEVAVNRGRADDHLGAERGDSIRMIHGEAQ